MEQDPGRDEALAAVRRLAAKPEVARSALDLLEEYYRSAGDLEQVVQLYDQRVELAGSDADRVALLTEAAALWERELGRPEHALAAMREAVRTDPRDRTLIDSLERLAELSGRWADLNGLVDDIAAQGDLERRELYELRLRSAAWSRDRMGDLDRAERALTDALALDPEPVEAYEQLAALLRDQHRAADLVTMLRAWSDAEPSVDRRIALLREAAERARDELSHGELAADCYQALIALDVRDIEALRALCDIRASQSRWNEVVGLLERQLEVADDAERGSIARLMGEVYRDRLDDPRAAISAYEKALEIDGEDAAAMDALEALYREHDRIEALRALLERRAAKAAGPELTTFQLRLAQLYEQSFRDRQAAIQMFRRVLDAEPQNETARRDLERLFEATGAWDDLIALLDERLGTASHEARRQLLERIGELHGNRRGDTDAAIRIYERIDAELGADERSLRALVDLYEREKSWTKMADALERLAGRLRGAAAIELCHRVADLWEQRVGDSEQAGRALRGAYERFPEDRDTRERLKRHLEARGDHQALAQVLDQELQTAESPADRLALLRQISNVYRDRLGDPAAAASYLERAVALDGEDREALVPLCDLYMAAGREQDAVPILRRIIESFGRQRGKELALHYHRLGQALAGAGDAAGALEAYDAAFKIDLTNVAILRDLGKLTHATGDLDRAQKSFRALLLQKLEPDSGIQKADVYYFLGDIAAQQNDPRKAITMLERALAEDAGHAQASELLARLKG
jgi:tetratricopeptide (TPR) repeat protein